MPIRIPTVRAWWRHVLPAIVSGLAELVALWRARRAGAGLAKRSGLPSRVRLS